MALDLNTSPYYDDFDESKKFHRILFKPGYAVQARELTQLQSILQNQVNKFGDHIFKNGAIVSGCDVKIDNELSYVKIDANAAGNASLPSYIGATVEGSNGLTAVIVDAIDATATDPGTLYLRYTSGDGSTNTVHFIGTETLEVVSDNASLDGDEFTVQALEVDTEVLTNNYWGRATRMTLGDGILYIDGKFVLHTSQTIYLSKYTHNPTGSVCVGADEQNIDSGDDETLLDPAQGTYNFTAPGADRYYVSTLLKFFAVGTEIDDGYYEVATVVLGGLNRTHTSDIYAKLGDNLARRTYDESGNYTVKSFPVLVREHLDDTTNNGLYTEELGGSTDLLAVGLEAGKAYVRGYEYETRQTEYAFTEKGIDTVKKYSVPISSAYGNYVVVTDYKGVLPLDGSKISLRDAAQNGVSGSQTAAQGSEIGSARVRHIEYVSGTVGSAAAVYNIYVYDVQMTSGNFADVDGLYYSTSGTKDGYADVVESVLKSAQYNKLLYRMPSRATKTIRPAPSGNYETSLYYTKVYTGVSITSGAGSITLSGNEFFIQNANDAIESYINNNLLMVRDTGGEIIDLTTGTVDALDASSQILSFTALEDSTSSVFTDTVTIYSTVEVNLAAPLVKTLNRARYVAFDLSHKILASAVNVSTETFTYTSHGYSSGDAVVYYNGGGTSVTGLTSGTTYYVATAGLTANAFKVKAATTSGTLAATVATSGSAGQFTCGNSTLAVADRITITGTLGGSGTITGYTSGTVYKVSAKTGTSPNVTGFTLTTESGDAIVTTAGSLTGLTYTTETVIDLTGTGNDAQYFFKVGGGTSLNLGVADIFSVDAVYKAAVGTSYSNIVTTGTDIASQYTLDNGQRDNTYELGKLTAVNGAASLAGFNLVAKISYFTHTETASTAGYFAVDSYPVNDAVVGGGNIKTYEIPIYTSTTTGESYDLRDTLDFRIRITDSITPVTFASIASVPVNPATSTTVYPASFGLTIPRPEQEININYEYYVGRKDKIVLDDNGVFSAVSGTPSLTPVEPLTPENAMCIAIVTIPPFPSLAPNVAKSTGRNEYGVTFRTLDNRRYTMRDIGGIAQRITRLEYYTSLTLLEKSTESLFIPSAADPTLNRFKHGILVDAFTGHNVGNPKDLNYSCSIDAINQELRPFFNIENVDLIFDSVNSLGVKKTGDLLTLPYNYTVLTQNTFASKSRNCVGDLLFSFIGDMTLDPPVDNWTDTAQSPDLAVNFDGNYDNFAAMANSWGTQWNDWQDIVTGRSVSTDTTSTGGQTRVSGDTLFQDQIQISTTTTTQRQTRQGVTMTVTPETITRDLGDRVTNASIIPYMRSVTITVKCKRLKPATRIYPFFDGIDVTAHCRPLLSAALAASPTDPAEYSQYAITNGTGDYGDSLITDANGELAIQFRIPAGTFRTGTKNFRVCDDPFNRSAFVTTSATNSFSANGLSQVVQGTVVSTREANVAFNTVSDSRSVTESNTTANRIGERAVGVVQNTTVNNTFTTVNNTTNVSNTTNNTTVVNETNVINTVVNAITNVNETNITNNPVIVIEREVPVPPIVTPPEELPPPPTPPVDSGPPSEAVFIEPGDFGGFGVDQLGNNWGISLRGGVFGLGGMDPLAQSFFVDGMPFGTFVTGLDVYFRTKGTAPITLQLREMINGFPTEKVLPFGEVTKTADEVATSTEDADGVVTFSDTNFTFPSPVYLQNNTEYCFVLLPAGNDPGYNAWVSEIGENEVGTEKRISEQPNVGMLFTSANNRTWSEKQAEDIKFTLYRAIFDTSVISTAKFQNSNYDYLALNDVMYLYVEGAADTVSLTKFAAGEKVYVEGHNSDDAEPKYGYVKQYDPLYNVLKIVVQEGVFTAADTITNGTIYTTVTEVENKLINSIQTNVGYMDFTPTTGVWSYAKTATGAAAGGTTFERLTFGETNDIPTEAAIYSKSNETADLDGDKSLNIRFGMKTMTDTVSPVIDLRKCSLICISNYINAYEAAAAIVTTAGTLTGLSYATTTAGIPGTLAATVATSGTGGEFTCGNSTLAVGSRVTITGTLAGTGAITGYTTGTTYKVSAVTGTSPNVTGFTLTTTGTGEENNAGTASSKYISRRVNLENNAEDLKVYLSNYLPTGTSARVYAKLQNPSDSRNFDDLDWVELETSVSPLSSTAAAGFVEYEYKIPNANKVGSVEGGEFTYTYSGATYTTYNTMAIKIVMFSTNSSVVPKFKELRAIALQI